MELLLMSMLLAILRLVTGTLGTKLVEAYRIREAAQNETQRLIADVAVKDIERQMADRAAAKEIRLATAGFWEMRLITAVIAGCATAHYLAVTLDTIGRFGWGIPKYPAPFDEYQGTILLSFFGVQAVGMGFSAIAAAIRGRK